MKRLDHYWYSRNVIAWLLLPLASLYCGLTYLRRRLYVIGLFKQIKSSVPVIIVGNITVGGTGKTPFLIYLCQYLKNQGYTPGIISRGYGGQSKHYPLCVTDEVTVHQAGDEPFMIAQRTACPVVVGPDRIADIALLQDKYECDIVIADDGMQHYRLQRDAEIAVVDANRKFGNGYCLPAGPLREPVTRLKSVDMIISNGGKDNQLSFRIIPGKLVSLMNKAKSKSLTEFSGQTVHAVAGIGNPQRFFDLLESQGINLITHAFPDHHVYKPSDFFFSDDLPVLMTEKDAVKCFAFKLDKSWYLPIDVELSQL
ncbi:MAG TPA: tetraacyldisaccharide 4'-kinase, partial [Gammaproteobacteria bacterium]